MLGNVWSRDANTWSAASNSRAASTHSTVSASRPLMMMLRHILIADATPSSPSTAVTFIPSAPSAGATVAAYAPPSSIGTARRLGGTGAITAASMYSALLGSTRRAFSRLVRSEEHTSELQSLRHL